MKIHLATRLRRDELKVLKFKQNSQAHKELEWHRKDEFEFRSKLYDVVFKEDSGDTTLYWCWPDEEETQLGEDFKSMLAQAWGSDPFQKENQGRLTRFLKKNFQLPSGQVVQEVSDLVLRSVFPFSENYSSLSSTPPDPPPPNLFG